MGAHQHLTDLVFFMFELQPAQCAVASAACEAAEAAIIRHTEETVVLFVQKHTVIWVCTVSLLPEAGSVALNVYNTSKHPCRPIRYAAPSHHRRVSRRRKQSSIDRLPR